MVSVDTAKDSGSSADPVTSPTASEVPAGHAWELVETGRYRPRRIRGSFPGRELG